MKNECIICGKECPQPKLWKQRKYCSDKCKSIRYNFARRKYKKNVTKNCEFCNEKFMTEKHNPNQKYCSKKCKKKNNRKKNYKKYLETERKHNERNREKIRRQSKEYYQKNKEKLNNKKKEYRKKDYNKWRSREITYKILTSPKKIISIKNNCKLCNSNENLQIHHEIYPITKQEIIKAISLGMIYYLCRKCHGKTERIKI